MYFKIKTKNNKNDGNKFDIDEVIDGQQRLLTIYIMLIVLKNEYKEIFDNMGFSLYNPCNQSDRIRFLTRVGSDQDDINKLLNNYHPSRSHKSNIFHCYKTIKDFFENETKDFINDANAINKYFNKFFLQIN